MRRTSDFYTFQTGVGNQHPHHDGNQLHHGLSISAQTFYTFILENLERFGALKAIGTKSRELVGMILFQASFTALTGYGLGRRFVHDPISLAKLLACPANHAIITYTSLLLAFVMVLIITVISSYFGAAFFLRIEPFRYFPRVTCQMWPFEQPGCASGSAKVMRQNHSSPRSQPRSSFWRDGLHRWPVRERARPPSVLSGILKPNSGRVSVEGVDIWSLNADQLAEFRLKKIGFVFQDFHLFPRLNTAENVAIPLILRKKDWDESIKEAAKYLEIVGLKGRENLPSGKAEWRRTTTRSYRSSHDRPAGHPDHG